MNIEEINAKKDALATTIRNLLIEFSEETRMLVHDINFDVRPLYRMGTKESVNQIYSAVILDVRLPE